jgi:hypothetical protein
VTNQPITQITGLRIDGSHLVAELAIDLEALNLTQVCAHCRQPMGAERSTKRFCSGACRAAARRRTQQGGPA